MRLPVMWVWLWMLGVWLSVGFAAQPGPDTLGARLGLEAAPGLTLTLEQSDALSARYRVDAPPRVPATVQTVTAYLVTQGWLEHPNVSDAPAPKPGVVQRLTSFVQGSDLLELRTSGAEGEITLEFTLISLEAPPQVAAVPLVKQYLFKF